jgi:hypothetical protein
MGLDIRWPIGYMFVIIGAVLAAYGLLSDATIYEQSLGMNVNLIWGAILAAFGIVMLLLAHFGKKSQQELADARNQNDRPAPTH